jgi:exodeoxyribonuclease VII large subunit
MQDPVSMLNERRLKLDGYLKQIASAIKLEVKNKRLKLVKDVSLLDGLSPLKTLVRGYSIVENKEGKLIKSVKDVKKNDEIKITLNDGNVEAKVL